MKLDVKTDPQCESIIISDAASTCAVCFHISKLKLEMQRSRVNSRKSFRTLEILFCNRRFIQGLHKRLKLFIGCKAFEVSFLLQSPFPPVPLSFCRKGS